jgi:hypothetical protein
MRALAGGQVLRSKCRRKRRIYITSQRAHFGYDNAAQGTRPPAPKV